MRALNPLTHRLAGLDHLHIIRRLGLQQYSRLAIQRRQNLVLLKAVNHGRHVGDAHCPSVWRLANNNLFKIGLVISKILGSQLHVACPGSNLADRDIHRVATNGGRHVGETEPVISQCTL